MVYCSHCLYRDVIAMSSLQPTTASVTDNPASSLPCQIRRMRDADVDAVLAIESVSFGEHHWSGESFRNEMKNQIGRYYVLEEVETQKILGYCGFWIILDECHITTVAIDPACRGKSYGELLIAHVLDKVMGHTVRWVTLEVRLSNFSAQNLYLKYGFIVAGTRHKYYQDNDEDAMIMTAGDILAEDYRAQFKPLKASLLQKLGYTPHGFGL